MRLYRRACPASLPADRQRSHGMQRRAAAIGCVCARPALPGDNPGMRPASPLRLMAVHAHPDDESSKGAATMARYVAEGVDVLVVDVHRRRGGLGSQPGDGPARGLGAAAELRREEMGRAREILGVRQSWLGFVDSGFPEGDPPPPLPEGCFALVPIEVAAEPLVRARAASSGRR